MMFSRHVAFLIFYLRIMLIASYVEKTEQCVTLTETSGMIESPGYPENYPNNAAFNWSIRLHKLTNIEFTIQKMDIEVSSSCKLDSLNIYQGDEITALARIGKPMCGYRGYSQDEPGYKIYAVGHTFLITFLSDATDVGTGFRMLYKDHDTLVAEMCNGLYTNMSYSGYIRSNAKYPANISCEWTIASPPGYDLMLEVNHFDLSYSVPNCSEEYMDLTLKFRNQFLPETTRYCGRRHYWREGKYRQISEIIIHFRSDSIHSDGGFELFYEFTKPNVSSDYSVVFKTIKLTNGNHEIVEPSLIDGSCLVNTSYCQIRLLIETDIGHRVRLTLHNNSVMATVLSHRLLQIYDDISINIGSEITENPRRMQWGDVMFYSSGHFMFIVVHLRLKYVTDLADLNVSFASESIFLNSSTDIVSCTLSGARLSQIHTPGSWTLSFKGNKDWSGRSSFCIRKFDFGGLNSLQISTILYISEAANNDGCSVEGIALYVVDASEANIIGPFCELRRNFVKSVLNKLVLTGRKFYLYVYSYTVADVNSIESIIKILIEKILCKRIQLTVHHLPIITSTSNGSVDVLIEREDAYHLFVGETNLFINDGCGVISIHNLLVDRPSKPLHIHSNRSLKTCFYTVIDRSQSEQYIPEVCENGSLVGDFYWSFASIQIGEAKNTCPYSMTCAEDALLQTSCGSIELLPMRNVYSRMSCSWTVRLDNMFRDTQHYIRIFIEIFNGEELKINEVTHGTCYNHEGIVVAIRYRVWEYEYKTARAYCLTLVFKYSSYIFDDVLIADYSLEKYQLPIYNATEDAIYINRKRYTKLPNPSTYEFSNDQCKNLSSPGKLVSINTKEELEQLMLAVGTVWSTGIVGGMAYLIGLTDVDMWREHRWADGNPLTFTDWYVNGSVENTLLSNGHNPPPVMGWQPAYTWFFRCVMMVISNPHYSSNWVKVNCDNTLVSGVRKLFFICESNIKLDINIATMERSTPLPVPEQPNINQHPSPYYVYTPSQVQRRWSCKGNWYIVNDVCVLLIGMPLFTSVRFNSTSGHAVNMCGGVNSVFLANEDNLEQVLNYLHALDHKPSYGAIWVRLNQTDMACLQTIGQVTGDRILGRNWTLSRKCHTAELRWVNIFDRNARCVYGKYSKYSRILQQSTPNMVLLKQFIYVTCTPMYVLCMHHQEEIQRHAGCKPYQFSCADGSCLSPDSVCDGHPDCIGGEDEKTCGKPDMSFECNNKSVIPISKYCDFQSDCSDNEDESNCKHVTTCRSGEDRHCRNKQCLPHDQLCDGVANCLDKSDHEEGNCNTRRSCGKPNGFLCSSGQCIAHVRALPNDRIADCPDASDISIVRWQERKPSELDTWCKHSDGRLSQSHFPRTQVCIHADIDERICRDLSHLHHCEKFICPWGYFKCASSYCLPIRKVCDGKWDCMDGEDELDCDHYACPGLLRCGRSQNCLSSLDADNEIMDCPLDPSDVKYRSTWDCPSECYCHGYIFDCSSSNITYLASIQPKARVINLENSCVEINNSTFFTFPYLAILNLNRNNLTLLPIDIFQMQHNLLTLYLRGNKIRYIIPGTFKKLGNLKYLDIRENQFQIIDTDTFRGLSLLPDLNISHCGIHILKKSAFRGLSSLKTLDLSSNVIEYIGTGTFADLAKLVSLNLTGNSLKMVPLEIFEEIQTDHLFTSSFRFCCFAACVDNCLPKKTVFSSCNDLMANSFLQITIWITGVLSISGNCIVIGWRLLSGIDSPCIVLICNLALSDLLMGVYLVVLASFDIHYRGEYIIHDVNWREGFACKCIGFLATLSSQMSLFLLVCITSDRFWKIVYPLSSKVLTRKAACIVCGTGWVITILTCALPFFDDKFFGYFYAHNSVCLPYRFSPLLTSGWQYLLVVFILPDAVGCIYIIVAYSIIFRSINQSQTRAGIHDNESEIKIARKLFLIVITDLICWMPILIFSLGGYMGLSLNPDTVAFLAVLILPVNGAINPYLYTLHARCKNRGPTRPVVG